ncbi:MAG: hypothetical protein M1379_16945 [Firmicutes bacterium]|nr:hypothetical protein [Bacillota bacterium]
MAVPSGEGTVNTVRYVEGDGDPGKVLISAGGREMELEVRSLPQEFLDWQVGTRLEGIRSFLTGSPQMNAFGAHLPVLSTVDTTTSTFPVNSAGKGVGLTVRKELLEEYTAKFETLIREGLKKGWHETMAGRLEALLDYYSDASKFDRTVLSSLELYARRTYTNVLADPRVTLLYVGMGAEGLKSYAVHCVAELVPPGDLFYRFAAAVHDLFHVPGKHQYPFAYRLWVCEVYDKAPGSRASQRLV